MLALLTLKDYVYGALLAVLLALGGWYTLHVFHDGERVIEAADHRVAVAEAARHAAEVANAKAQEARDEAVFQASVAAPTLHAPSVVCAIQRAAGPSELPKDAGPAAGGDGGAAVPAEATGPVHTFNPAPAALAEGRNADAQVTLLEAYIRDCQKQGMCARK